MVFSSHTLDTAVPVVKVLSVLKVFKKLKKCPIVHM